MDNTWDILTRELALNGVKFKNNQEASLRYEGKWYQIPIRNQVRLIEKQVKKNTEYLNELWEDVLDVVDDRADGDCYKTKSIDCMESYVFVEAIKGLYALAADMVGYSENSILYFSRLNLFRRMRAALDTDVLSYPQGAFQSIPRCRIAIDWVIRTNSRLWYVRKLLRFTLLADENIAREVVKVARGISGPWANLDLPMQERVFSWDDIRDDVSGRQKQKQDQRRYTQPLEEYNSGRVKEGYYWREIRNEPFSWYDRATENPYPSRYSISQGNWQSSKKIVKSLERKLSFFLHTKVTKF